MPGLDNKIIDSINKNLAIASIQKDIQTDFILAPHYNIIFLKAADELWGRTYELLRSGKYQPELALTISVPKARIFTRPGSILQPIDRLVYQSLADSVADILEAQMDRSRTFSHVLADDRSEGFMFEAEHLCWTRLQKNIEKLAQKGGYFVKADVANYFERLPQHHLINLMNASGCRSEITRLLDEMFLAFQERDSFGLIQGLFPSDLFGNYYLSDLDAYFDMNDIPSARFVDDIYLHFEAHTDAIKGLMILIEQLRREGLHLNEYKSNIYSAEELIREETELDRLFQKTILEIQTEEEEKEIKIGYGFAANWELEEEEEFEEASEEIHTTAVTRLYKAIRKYPKQSDKIERFCLPYLRASYSDMACDRSIDGIIERPYLVRLYTSYLSRFVRESSYITKKLEKMLGSDLLISDYQRMYLLAAMMNAPKVQKETVKISLQILKDARIAQETRAIAAIFSARHGTPQQKRAVRLTYEGEASPYVRAAILYSSRFFTGNDKRICIKAWGGHNFTNTLISHALRA